MLATTHVRSASSLVLSAPCVVIARDLNARLLVQIIRYCGRKKDRGNALYAAGKFAYSLKRFDEALQALKTFRGDQTDMQTAAIRTVHVALLSNSAAALMGMKVCVFAVVFSKPVGFNSKVVALHERVQLNVLAAHDLLVRSNAEHLHPLCRSIQKQSGDAMQLLRWTATTTSWC
jgi:hypothetical protein